MSESSQSEIPKAYNPQEWEDSLYKTWEESGYFNPDNLVHNGLVSEDAEAFSIVLPPPNVTGRLHIGHATMLAIEDIMVRYHRMKGYKTLWIPGTDHAAIATQSKVESILHKEEGKTRHDFGREEFLKRVEAFAQDSHDTIVHQTAKMGSSVDWSREAYTLDEKRNFAVRTAFKRMYNEGIIFRGDRIVNWDPNLQTTVSDDEIEWKTEKTPFYYLQYGPFVISTARPETKFGDKYVVMHPNDERYKEYVHGQKIELEWINGPITATIIKDEAVDMEFGTGVMTITPWHDATDFDIAERHNLHKEQVIDFEGKLLSLAGEFSGMPISEARKKVIEKLSIKGLVVKTDEEYVHNIATNSRGGGVIEPQIKKQWFIGVNKEFERNGKKTTLKSLMQTAVRSGNVEIIPQRFEKIYFHWIDNLRDWCISRQIWYGHRIPVWYRGEEIFCGTEAPAGDEWEQDPDTLDTWFSSGLWTFSTLGWPDENAIDLKTFHPTSVLETGYDILFFWVARMILMSQYFLGEVPFRKVYLHGLVRDDQGRKMSKSLGNIIDPLDIIPEYGADALRLSLVVGSTPGNDIRLGKEKIVSFRNFTNKLWNIGRYILTQSQPDQLSPSSHKSVADEWILQRLSTTIENVTRHLDQYNFSLAGEALRDFTWNEFADWYVEVHKIEKNDAVLRYVFETLLKLWHPFMPFVTEALFQEIYPRSKKLLMVEKWPETLHLDEQPRNFGRIISVITSIRNLRSTYRIDPGKKVSVLIVSDETEYLSSQRAIIEKLARVGDFHISSNNHEQSEDMACTVTADMSICIRLGDSIDTEQEERRLSKEMGETSAYIARLKAKLSNETFLAKAPEAIVNQTKKELSQVEEKASEIEKRLKQLKA